VRSDDPAGLSAAFLGIISDHAKAWEKLWAKFPRCLDWFAGATVAATLVDFFLPCRGPGWF